MSYDNDTAWNLVAEQRKRLASDLEGLTEADLSVPTELKGWDAKHLLAHLVTPFLVPTIRFVGSMVRFGGNLDKVNNKYASRLSERPLVELVEVLNANANSKWVPPGESVGLPLTEIVVHGQELRRALGLEYSVPAEAARLVDQYESAKKKSTPASRENLANRLAPVASQQVETPSA